MKFRSAACAALAVCSVALTGCSGSDGVSLGHDWKGSETFVTANVSGHTVVVGIDPAARHAQSLAVVPSEDGDDDVLAPQLVQFADGRWMLTTPRKGNRPDRFFEVDPAAGRLEEKAHGTDRLRQLAPGSRLVAAVYGVSSGGGGAQTATAGGDSTSVLVHDAATWRTVREARAPGAVALAASDPGSDTLCVTSGEGADARASVVDLGTGRVTAAGTAGGVQVQQLACPGGKPVLVGTPAAPGRTARATLTRRRAGAATVVTVDGGRVDAAEASGNTLVAAVNTGDDTDLVAYDTAAGREVHRVHIRGMDNSLLLRHTRSGWLLVSDDTATVVDLDRGTARTFGLPGTLTSF
ncbi:hypothetical protein [Streptomyces tropicalis]|uniref:Lipoprotein n=1 Tax=Streptomyces tropicalis TaxID=3034234 RepID=A0ABT6A9K7_9ACTN|nr:hypothetical protein [Streptomyces tropicalis]MDF3301026.1 hypothetical protein [Streptomyces tropicalis]